MVYAFLIAVFAMVYAFLIVVFAMVYTGGDCQKAAAQHVHHLCCINWWHHLSLSCDDDNQKCSQGLKQLMDPVLEDRGVTPEEAVAAAEEADKTKRSQESWCPDCSKVSSAFAMVYAFLIVAFAMVHTAMDQGVRHEKTPRQQTQTRRRQRHKAQQKISKVAKLSSLVAEMI